MQLETLASESAALFADHGARLFAKFATAVKLLEQFGDDSTRSASSTTDSRPSCEAALHKVHARQRCITA